MAATPAKENGRECIDEPKITQHIGGKLHFDAFGRLLAVARRAGGIVDQDGGRTELLLHFRQSSLQGCFVSNICHAEEEMTWKVPGKDFATCRGPYVKPHDSGAALQEGFRIFTTKLPGYAGNQDNLMVDIE